MNYQKFNYPNGYKRVPRDLPENIPLEFELFDDEVLRKQKNHFIETPLPMKESPKLNLFMVDEAYINGTIFKGLFRPYKNFKPISPSLTTEKEKMLFDVNKYYFAMTEFQFYLNNFPNDPDALRIFNEFRKGHLKAKEAYEAKFGALNIFSNQLEEKPWNWTKTLSPWERGV